MSKPTSQSFVTDGGLETDLIFNHGVDLPTSPPSRWSRRERPSSC